MNIQIVQKIFTERYFISLKSKRKLVAKAFSMTEVIIAMTITAIIVSIIFTIFSIMSEMLLDFKKANEEIADLNRFTYCINKDIFESEIMSISAAEIQFTLASGQQTFYFMSNNYIVRKNEYLSDTFKLESNRLRIDTIRNSNKSKVYRNLKIDLNINGNATNLSFYKRLYANDLMMGQ